MGFYKHETPAVSTLTEICMRPRMYDRSNDKVLLQSGTNILVINERWYNWWLRCDCHWSAVWLYHNCDIISSKNMQCAIPAMCNVLYRAIAVVPLPYTCSAFINFYYSRKVSPCVLVRTHSVHRARHGSSATRAQGWHWHNQTKSSLKYHCDEISHFFFPLFF